MHVLLFRVFGQRYAVPTSAIVEVVSVVQAQSVPRAEQWLRGRINYRGRLIPLLDFSVLLGHPPRQPLMANRIVVLRAGEGRGEGANIVGLLVEDVQGCEAIDFSDSPAHARLAAAEADFLGAVTLFRSAPVQLVEVARLPLVPVGPQDELDPCSS
jgi:chemotaxis signal transduction protein